MCLWSAEDEQLKERAVVDYVWIHIACMSAVALGRFSGKNLDFLELDGSVNKPCFEAAIAPLIEQGQEAYSTRKEELATKKLSLKKKKRKALERKERKRAHVPEEDEGEDGSEYEEDQLDEDGDFDLDEEYLPEH